MFGIGNVVALPSDLASKARTEMLQSLEALPDDHIVLSVDHSFNREILNQQRLSTTRVLGAMALAGVETLLPMVPDLPMDELAFIRERVQPERDAYLDALTQFVADARERIRLGDFNDAFDYAAAKSTPHIRTRLREFERATAERAIPIRQRIATAAADGLPDVGLIIERSIQASAVSPALGAAVLAGVFRPIWRGVAEHVRDRVRPIECPAEISFVVGLRNSLSRRDSIPLQ